MKKCDAFKNVIYFRSQIKPEVCIRKLLEYLSFINKMFIYKCINFYLFARMSIIIA